MLIIKSDSFANYKNIEGRFWKKSDESRLYQIQINKKDEATNLKYNLLGFKDYIETELKDKMYIDVYKEEINSAYRVRTFCCYQNGKYQINERIVNNTVYLFPDLETKKKIGFHIYNDNAIEITYDKFINEVEEIWEEREPIEGFKFDVEPIHYIR